MNLLNLFTSKNKKVKLAHLKRLLAVAAADGVILDSEKEALTLIMVREGLTPSDLERCFKKPEGIEMIAPDNVEIKHVYLRDMVHLMMIDGDIDKNEMLVCKLAAIELGYRPEIIDKIILETIVEIKASLGL